MLPEEKLIFLSCLPRSGSTLLQGLLDQGDEVFTESEGWLMLPLLDLRLDHTLETVYNRNTASQAVNDFLESIPSEQLDTALSTFALTLYSGKKPETARYLLDKTPRYYLISQDLERIFPRARHIYLTRNPLAVLTSIYASWAAGDPNALLNYQVDLVDGVRKLAHTVSTTPHLTLSYEELLGDSESVLSDVADYTGLTIPGSTVSYDADRGGQLGDDREVFRTGKLDSSHADRWSGRLSDPVLYNLARAYLDSLDQSIFDQLGYSRSDSESILAQAESRYRHDYDPGALMIADMNLEHFFSEVGVDKSTETWFALRKRTETLRKTQLQLVQIKGEKKVLQGERDALSRHLQAVNAEIDSLREKKSDLENEIAATRAEREQLKSEREQLKSELAVTRAEREQLKSELAVNRGHIRHLEAAVEVYEKLANSKWVRLGNQLNRPVQALRAILK